MINKMYYKWSDIKKSEETKEGRKMNTRTNALVLEKILIKTDIKTLQEIAETLKLSVYDVIDIKNFILERVRININAR